MATLREQAVEFREEWRRLQDELYAIRGPRPQVGWIEFLEESRRLQGYLAAKDA